MSVTRTMAVVACVVLALVAGWARGQFEPAPVLVDDQDDPAGRVVLGRVVGVAAERGADGVESVEYRVSVMREWWRRIRAGEVIVVIGRRVEGREESIPKWKEGDVVLVTLKATEAAGRFAYSPRAVAMGALRPIRIAEKEVEAAVEGMKEMEKVFDGPHGNDALRRKAEALMCSENYYLWALGASLWVKHIEGDDDVLRLYPDVRVALRKVIWADWVSGQIEPPRFRPDRARRLLRLNGYLRSRFAELPLLPEKVAGVRVQAEEEHADQY